MTIFWLIRHGQTDWNLENRFQGSTDTHLNAEGIRQAETAAERLNGAAPTVIYSSPLQRAHTTAQIIADTLNLPIITDPRLQEIALGDWEGQLGADLHRLYPEQFEARRQDPVGFHAPNGESLTEVAARAGSLLNELSDNHPEEEVVIVSHGVTLGVVHCLLESTPIDQTYQNIPDNASPLRLERNGRVPLKGAL